MNAAILKEILPMKFNAETRRWEYTPEAHGMAKAWGYANPLKMAKGYMQAQRKALFGLDDILRLQATYHHQALTGASFKESWKEVSRHLPDYTIPTHVGIRLPGTDIDMPSKLLASGFSSKLLIFGRYHYGKLKSYGHTLEDLASKSTPSGTRWKAADRLAMPLVTGLLYTYLGAKLAQKLSGKPDAEASPSGATALPWTIMRLMQGKTTLARAAASNFTPSPLVDFTGHMLYGLRGAPKPFGEQIENAVGFQGPLSQPSRLKLSGGLLGEVGPIRSAEQARRGATGKVDWGEMARRELLNVYAPKASGGPGRRGPTLAHLPRMR
jgi:hypothetical protein